MKALAAIVRRELIATFSSPLAWIVMAAFLLLQGALFVLIVGYLSQPGQSSMSILQAFFGGTIFFWFFLVVAPLITMRLVAEERRSGTIEVLLTSPVTEGQVIVAKFAAVWLFYLVLWLPTLVYVLMVKSQADIDWGAVASSYLGVALFGALFVSLGLLASTLSRNQIVAAVIAFTGLIVLFALPLLRGLLLGSSGLAAVIDHADLWQHMADYAKGIVDTRHVVYELSLTVLFLFLATKSLELSKWR
ncbi:MAG TPA: ABC transporter permease [Candidatus Sulfomarinibacteraceae bacterium]|jgi:ABC-2 type transport system permease protein|nr:ABC transporter permease [Candidatus Sulfomarinibacteraceae bacterium]